MTALFVVLGSIVLVGAIMKTIAFVRRSRLTHDFPEDAIVHQQRGVSMRVLIQGPPVFPGMSTSKANRTLGDLVLLEDRFVLACNRGKLLDLQPAHEQMLSSARCTGPGRLVLEGALAVPAGVTGHYRIEVATERAKQWAEALEPFVDPADRAEFTSWAG